MFREALLDYWDGACAVTDLYLPEALRARVAPAHQPFLHRHREHVFQS